MRGSIPLLWSQTPCLKYKIPIRIAPPSRNDPVFATHARALADGYKARRTALCCAVLRCAVLCCAALRCAVLCCAALRCAVLCCAALRCLAL